MNSTSPETQIMKFNIDTCFDNRVRDANQVAVCLSFQRALELTRPETTQQQPGRIVALLGLRILQVGRIELMTIWVKGRGERSEKQGCKPSLCHSPQKR